MPPSTCNFFRVTGFRGEPHGRENQALAWQSIERIEVEPVLPGQRADLRRIGLAERLRDHGRDRARCRRALRDLDIALARGLRLIQVREPDMNPVELRRFAGSVVQRAHAHRARVLVNADVALARECGADGLHLKAAQLRALRERPALPLVGASCHDAEELRLARDLGTDFVVLGPVAPTPSHPGALVLGWERVAQLLRGYPLPAYALGGMTSADLDGAWRCGAHGVAMQRGAWKP